MLVFCFLVEEDEAVSFEVQLDQLDWHTLPTEVYLAALPLLWRDALLVESVQSDGCDATSNA